MGYGGKLIEQQRARELRATGWTYAEICEELGVSRSSVSLWVRDVAVDEDAWAARAQRNRNLGARRRGPNVLQRAKQQQIERCAAEGVARVGELSERDLFVAGIALYAGEGSKTDGGVRFANSDPTMISLFLRWFRTFWDVDERRLRVRLYLHEDLDLDAAIAFWVAVTAIPRDQFNKPYRAAADATLRRNRHVHGCPCIVYGSSSAHRDVMGLVRALLSSSAIDPG